MPQQASPLAGKELRLMFNPQLFSEIADLMTTIEPAFEAESFLNLATNNLDDLSIMQRMNQTATSLAAALPISYEKQLDACYQLAPLIPKGFISTFLPEFVATQGLEHFDLSMESLHYFTQFGSSEFAVRHFLVKDFERALRYMKQWSSDENEHMRRLASEGCRPRLPWSFQLKNLIKDPTAVWPILENLNADPSLYVRKSVANHLNDISKDHPTWLLQHLENWDLQKTHTNWIVHRALRTLIKSGDSAALDLIGVNSEVPIKIRSFALSNAQISLGAPIELAAEIELQSRSNQKLVIDYAVHYVKKNGSTSKKVFKWKTLTLAPKEIYHMKKKQWFRDYSTRTHYSGRHLIELMINGKVVERAWFMLV